MTTGEIIKSRRKELDISAEFIAQKLGIARSTVFRYERGDIEKVPSDILIPLSRILRLEPSELMGLKPPKTNSFENAMKKLRFFNIPVSAGTGQWLAEGHEYEYEEFEHAPRGADFALKVKGDSMEPMYCDNDIVFVKQNVIIESGQIGIFCLNDEGYMKMLQGNKLVSLNPTYKPIIVDEFDVFFCAGRVIGKN